MSLKRLAPPPYDELQPGYQEEGDFGAVGEWVPEGPPVTVKMRRLTGAEKVAAGVDTAFKLFRMWTDDAVTFDEGTTLRHESEGDLNTTSIVNYPERNITVIEAVKVGS